jgi:hypothetical protein
MGESRRLLGVDLLEVTVAVLEGLTKFGTSESDGCTANAVTAISESKSFIVNNEWFAFFLIAHSKKVEMEDFDIV